jgi:hypothetical protein
MATCALVLTAVSPVRADGWHNAALATASLDEWVNQVAEGVPGVAERLTELELSGSRDLEKLEERARRSRASGDGDGPAATDARQGGGSLRGRLNPEQQALLGRKAGDCLELLALMDARNIVPGEFPRFEEEQAGKIPRYRGTAKQLLKLMGKPGAEAVVARLCQELMAQGSNSFDPSLTPNPQYHADLLEVLRELGGAGHIAPQDLESLQRAASGRKSGPQAALAQKVQSALAELLNAEVATMVRWAAAADDARVKKELDAKIRKRIRKADAAELAAAYQEPELSGELKKLVATELIERLGKAGVADLLAVLDGQRDEKVRKAALLELAERSPKYSEVKSDVPAIVRHASSADEEIAAAARRQLANAFARAPMIECLRVLGRADPVLKDVIQEQIDRRVASAVAEADAEKQKVYRESAAAMLKDSKAADASRLAAIELLRTLKSREGLGDVIDLVPLLPRELWPAAGQMLRDVTGQDFGPRPGDGFAEVGQAVKQWRAWWKSVGGE